MGDETSGNTSPKYKLVLGLEIHLHLKTATKMFCGCDADIWQADPNTHTCPTCLGLPGALPVPNFEAIEKTQLLGLALGAKLNHNSRFDRKHYFYPDLPKGFQITQYQQPFCEGGEVPLDSGRVGELERIHLEEDTAKSFHEGGENGKTLIDFNKSGMPLVEIVTKPCFTTSEDAADFGKKIRDTVRLLKISDADMEKGQMRLEANISLRTAEMEERNELPKYKVEVKNINSFKFMEKAVRAEIARQTEILERGETPIQENRGYDEAKNTTVSQRGKEEAHDYRYFPEPDIPPMEFTEDHFEKLRAQIPELPWEIQKRLVSDYEISVENAVTLSAGGNDKLREKFEQIVRETKNKDLENSAAPAKIANLLLNKVEFKDLETNEFVQKLQEQDDKISDASQLEEIAKKVIAENPQAVETYQKGKTGALEFLVGQVMRETKGKADAKITRVLVEDILTK